ncbi:hypothetical protein GGR50DRAFT_361451 [Xylaria sp. CBS 124048]|nr:hypothetical protein GGR50DRAFT_361451 [Xylaria sp. CBS 124048]
MVFCLILLHRIAFVLTHFTASPSTQLPDSRLSKLMESLRFHAGTIDSRTTCRQPSTRPNQAHSTLETIVYRPGTEAPISTPVARSPCASHQAVAYLLGSRTVIPRIVGV